MLLIYDNLSGRVSQVEAYPSEAFIQQLESNGVPHFVLGNDPTDTYIDLTGPNPLPRRRPVLPDIFPKYDLEAAEVVTADDVPACSILINGPTQNGFVEHPGGPIKLRFLIPGEYTVGLELFPYQRREFRFNVTNTYRESSK